MTKNLSLVSRTAIFDSQFKKYGNKGSCPPLFYSLRKKTYVYICKYCLIYIRQQLLVQTGIFRSRFEGLFTWDISFPNLFKFFLTSTICLKITKFEPEIVKSLRIFLYYYFAIKYIFFTIVGSATARARISLKNWARN